MKIHHLTLAALLALPLPTVGQSERPNIIFIIGDDMDRFMFNFLLDAGDPGALSGRVAKNFDGKSVLSPNLDQLASEGMTFANQYVVTPACTPSRYSMMTGRYGSRATNQAWSNFGGMRYPYFNMAIESTDVTVPSLLREAGYRTGFVGKDHVSDVTPPEYDKDIPDNADPNDPAIRARLEENVDDFRSKLLSYGFDYAAGIYPKNPAELPARADTRKAATLLLNFIRFFQKSLICPEHSHTDTGNIYLTPKAMEKVRPGTGREAGLGHASEACFHQESPCVVAQQTVGWTFMSTGRA